jgi:hypothetical protein
VADSQTANSSRALRVAMITQNLPAELAVRMKILPQADATCYAG